HSHLEVSTTGITIGQTVVDIVDSWKQPKNVYVPLKVDENKYKELFFKIVFGEEVAEMYRKYVLS
ncbi:MAG: hypothetical protein KAJ22_04080, partial [Candidatus Izimaplasma sp.]|nr:hypothetical protein [Candidatus Izimaplasma bacterium]